MDDSIEKAGVPQSPPPDRTQDMMNLSRQYKGAGNIPEDALTEIGYVRTVMTDGTFRLVPRERALELASKENVKDKERPFTQFSLDLPVEELPYRFIPENQIGLLKQRLLEAECAFYPGWETLVDMWTGDGFTFLDSNRTSDRLGNQLIEGNHSGTFNNTREDDILFDEGRLQNLRTFAIDFINFTSSDAGIIDGVNPVVFQNLFHIPLPEISQQEGYLESREAILEQMSTDLDITTTSTQAIYHEVNKLEGIFTDTPFLVEQFRTVLQESVQDHLLRPYEALANNPLVDNLQDDEMENEYEVDELRVFRSIRESITNLHEIGIENIGEALKLVFPQYLATVGLTEMASLIQNAESLHNIGESLQYMDLQHAFYQEEKQIKSAIKTASPEDRIVLNKRIKEIDGIKKKRVQIKKGVIDYFTAPQVYVDICQKKIAEVQEFLVPKTTGDQTSVRYTFDATDNAEIDRDPGNISGDCTAGLPLQFDNPDLPLYNIKVFNEGHDHRHVGNMYLYVTNTTEEEEDVKVWHLDAIQIPRKDIHWSESIGVIMDGLAEQAKMKGIKAITLNSKLHNISNYDYIANAVSEYWEENGRQITNVTIPKFHLDSRSDMQGNGEAIVGWSENVPFNQTSDDLEGNSNMFNADGLPLGWN